MEFAETLYRVNTEPLMVVVDEADVIIPQRLAAELMRLLGAMEDIAKRGRQRGLGILVISQRVADVNKSVTDLLETLLLFAVTGTRTRKAIGEWIDDHADPAEARQVVATLSTLEPGECWVWSPSFLRLLKRVQLLRPDTFDSHATPAPGQRRRAIKTVADVDVSAVKEQMAATIERAQADDPAALRRKITRLEVDLHAAEQLLEQARAARPEPVETVIEVPGFDDALLARLEEALAPIFGVAEGIQKATDGVLERVGAAQRLLEATAGRTEPTGNRTPARPGPAPKSADPGPDQDVRADSGGTSRRTSQAPIDGLSGPQRRVLDAIAWLAAVGFPEPSKQQVGFIAGYRVGKKVGGTYGNILGELRSANLDSYPSPGNVALTGQGEAAATPADIPRTTAGLQGAVMGRLSEPERRVLQVLIDNYPDSVNKQDLGAAAGYTVGAKVGGTFGNILGRLRTLGLIGYPTPGEAAAEPVLFLGRGGR